MLDSTSECLDGLEDGDEEEEGDEDEDGECRVHDSDYLSRLHKAAGQLIGLADDDSSDSDFTEDEDVETPIAGVDPFTTFAETMALLEKAAPDRIQSLMSGADANTQSAIRGMVEFARQRKSASETGADPPNGGDQAAQTQ